MKLLRTSLALVASVYVASAHTDVKSDDSKLNEALSLPNLISLSKIPSSWVPDDSTILEEGRVRLTPQRGTKGSLWEKGNYRLEDSFTLEWTFRSVDYDGKSEGGLSFWFLNSNGRNDLKDKSLYNGPSKFDGLQLLVDNNGVLGSTMRAQLNDGETYTKQDIYDRTFASCLMGYQESSVPSTLRLTYDRSDNNLLKLQIDNKVCFQTRKIQFPVGDYRIGVTADNANTPESFEILKMAVYDGPIEDSYLPNVRQMGQPRVLTQIIDNDTGEERVMEKEAYDIENDKVSNYELYKKLDRVEGKILANDINTLVERVDNLQKTQEELLQYLAQLTHGATVGKGKGESSTTNEDKSKYGDFMAINEKLEKMLVEQERIREANKLAGNSGSHIDDIAGKLALWLLPLIFIMLVMAYYTFKIRQEIVKTKLL